MINFYSRKLLFGFLSNFHRYPQVVDGVEFPTNEHYFQAHKALSPEVFDWIASAPSPYLAMKAGRTLRKGKEFRSGWDEIKVEIMLRGLRHKFKDPHLRNRLLATGDAILHEDSPTDKFWGKKGEDWLGRLLMQVRDEIRTPHSNVGSP